MARIFATSGCFLGFLAVAIGAFGAHGLKKHFETHPDLLTIFETGVQYHMYHALALLAVAWIALKVPCGLSHAAGYCFLVGIVIFSGSLYVMALTNVRWLGAITPIGGVAMLVGWICLGIASWRGLG